jgi:hypothetical protein
MNAVCVKQVPDTWAEEASRDSTLDHEAADG